jgi:hypothetical protein
MILLFQQQILYGVGRKIFNEAQREKCFSYLNIAAVYDGDNK